LTTYKHGDIGDIEIIRSPETLVVLESWDAKYGKPYLRDELEELNEKLAQHPEASLVGFVVDSAPDMKEEIKNRINELQELHEVKIMICGFVEWVTIQMSRIDKSKMKITTEWLQAFAGSLCLQRRERAPLDEPANQWVRELKIKVDNWILSQAN
jgi:hypothetical protein